MHRILCAALGGAVLMVSGCRESREQAKPPVPPAQVEVYVTKQQTIPVIFEHNGQVEASQQVDIRSRVTGVLMEQGFKEGTTVTAGQFLFRIDPRTFEADVRIGAASVQQAKTGVMSAERELNRTRQLAKTRAVAQEELDTAVTKYETAIAAQKLAEANLYKAQVELTYTTVTAPISGLVGEAEKRPGDLVDNSNNSLLCTISTQDPIWVNFFVSEREILDYKRDVAAGKLQVPADGKLPVSVTMLNGTKISRTGEINFFDVKIDPQTGTAMVRAELPNPEGILVPGQAVKVQVRGVTRSNMVVVPQQGVQQGMQGSFVYVVDEKKGVEMRPVQPGKWEGNSWIIESGLKPDEQIVIGGLMKVRPGAMVDVTTVTKTLPPDAIPAAVNLAQTSNTVSRQPDTTTSAEAAK